MIRDGWRLSVGTFTAIPQPPPTQVDRARAGAAVLFAPLAFVPVAVLVALGLWAGQQAKLSTLTLAVLGVMLLVLGNRAFHLDGLADTADALTASYSRERSLEVARLGNVGPAGVGAIVLVLGLQIAASASILSHERGPIAFAILACLSRAACVVGVTTMVPPARSEGMGATFARSVPVAAAAVSGVVVLGCCIGVSLLLGQPWWQGLVAALAMLAVTVALVVRSMRRLGGVIGDVLGASVEMAFAVLLVCFSVIL